VHPATDAIRDPTGRPNRRSGLGAVLAWSLSALVSTAAAQPSSTPGRDELTGRAEPSRLVLLKAPYTQHDGLYLEQETHASLVRMFEAAARPGPLSPRSPLPPYRPRPRWPAGVSLRVLSGYRSFDHQARIWKRAWEAPNRRSLGPAERARDILRYSSMPGTSRHAWGTEVDLYSLDPADFQRGEGASVHDWLVMNAHRFGFCQPYTPRSQGYETEPWHWTYMPVARRLQTAYVAQVTPDVLAALPFEGAAFAGPLKVLQTFVNSVDPDCMPRPEQSAGRGE